MTNKLQIRLAEEKAKVTPSVKEPKCFQAKIINEQLKALGMNEEDIIEFLALTNIVHKALGLDED